MADPFRRLRAGGEIGTQIANLLAILQANWGIVLSVLLSVATTSFAQLRDLVTNPTTVIAAGTFLTVLWTIIGVSVLIDRNRPKLVKSHPDYRYGLTLEGLAPSLDSSFDDAWINFGFQLRNFSQNPIKYTVTHFDVRIGTRALPRPEKIITGYLARGAGRTTNGLPFKKDDIKEFFGKRVNGTAEAEITYGHPEREPERRLKIRMDLTLGFSFDGSPPLTFGAGIVEEEDEAI